MDTIKIYTDGACIGNPGPGGYGAVLIHPKKRLELSGGFCLTTNNRMELFAVIAGLIALKTPCIVDLYSDSKYVVNAMSSGSAAKWRAKNWMRNSKESAVNPDLWERLIQLCSTHDVRFNWVKGHAGNVENEVCDRLATQAAQKGQLPHDVGYGQMSSDKLLELQKNLAMTLRCNDPLSLIR